ncbi:MAG: hypothetical protein U0324_41585 [Polyangiales bacterium]
MAARATSPWRELTDFPFRHFFYGAWRDGDRLAIVGGCSLGKPAPIVCSLDGGATWALEDFTSRRDFRCVTADARGDLWVGGDLGTLLTRRKGKWKRLRTGITKGIGRVWCEAPGVVYAVSHEGVIARTLDDGRTWETLARGTEAVLRALCGDRAGAFVAVGVGNAIVRSDGGERWEAVGAGVPAVENARDSLSAVRSFGPGRFLAGGEALLLRSDDGGRAWRDVTPACVKERGCVTSLCVTPKGTWYVGSLERIFRSDDEGATWVEEHRLAPGGMHRWVYALDVGDDGRGVAVGPHGTVYLRDP